MSLFLNSLHEFSYNEFISPLILKCIHFPLLTVLSLTIGLEYIIVSIPDPANATPASMKTAPHECVLCLPGHSFTVDVLAKHIHSAQHLINVLVSFSDSYNTLSISYS